MLCLSKHCGTLTEYVRQTVTISFSSLQQLRLLYIYLFFVCIHLFSFLTLISILCICHVLVNKVVCVCVCVTPCPCLVSLVDVCFCVRELFCLQNDGQIDRQNDRITPASLAEVITQIQHKISVNWTARHSINSYPKKKKKLQVQLVTHTYESSTLTLYTHNATIASTNQ